MFAIIKRKYVVLRQPFSKTPGVKFDYFCNSREKEETGTPPSENESLLSVK